MGTLKTMSDSRSLRRWENELTAARRDEVAALQALADLDPGAEDAVRRLLRDRLAVVRERKRTAKEVISGLIDIESVSPRETPFPGCQVC